MTLGEFTARDVTAECIEHRIVQDAGQTRTIMTVATFTSAHILSVSLREASQAGMNGDIFHRQR